MSVISQAPGGKSMHRDSYGRFAGTAATGDNTSLGWNDFQPMADFADPALGFLVARGPARRTRLRASPACSGRCSLRPSCTMTACRRPRGWCRPALVARRPARLQGGPVMPWACYRASPARHPPMTCGARTRAHWTTDLASSGPRHTPDAQAYLSAHATKRPPARRTAAPCLRRRTTSSRRARASAGRTAGSARAARSRPPRPARAAARAAAWAAAPVAPAPAAAARRSRGASRGASSTSRG